MKIGILTHQYINNYGAFLQAWALREAISELFPEDLLCLRVWIDGLLRL